MKLKSISISKNESWQREPDKFTARCHMAGNSSYEADINITIPENKLEPIVAILQQVIAEEMAKSAKAFHEEVMASLAGPVIEQPAIEGLAQ